MARWKWILLVVAGLIAVGVLVELRRRPEEPYIAEVALSDGVSRFRLLKMTDGPLDYDWKDPTPEILRMLPPPIGRRPVAFVPIHLDGYTQINRFPGVSLYFRPVDAEGRYTNGPTGVRGMFSPSIEFQESTGFVFRGPGPFAWPEHTAFGTAGLTVSALPRRDPMLKILIHEARSTPSSQTQVMEVKNPFYKPEFPVWQGKGLPQEVSVDHPSAPEGARIVLNKLSFREDGNLSIDHRAESKSGKWHPRMDVWLEDATGNRGRRLSPFEPAWKVCVALAPTAGVEYPDECVWRLGSWKRPADQSLVDLTPPQNLGGLKIESAFLAGAGCLQTVNGVTSMVPLKPGLTAGFHSSSSTSFVKGKSVLTHRLEYTSPFLVLKSPPVDHEFGIVARLRSEMKTIECSHGTSTSNTFQHTHVHLDQWPDDGEEWTLEVIFAKKPAVEFLVTPPDDARQALMKPPKF